MMATDPSMRPPRSIRIEVARTASIFLMPGGGHWCADRGGRADMRLAATRSDNTGAGSGRPLPLTH